MSWGCARNVHCRCSLARSPASRSRCWRSRSRAARSSSQRALRRSPASFAAVSIWVTLSSTPDCPSCVDIPSAASLALVRTAFPLTNGAVEVLVLRRVQTSQPSAVTTRGLGRLSQYLALAAIPQGCVGGDPVPGGLLCALLLVGPACPAVDLAQPLLIVPDRPLLNGANLLPLFSEARVFLWRGWRSCQARVRDEQEQGQGHHGAKTSRAGSAVMHRRSHFRLLTRFWIASSRAASSLS